MTDDGPTAQADLVETELEGTALLTNPMLNKGTAFTDEERTAFALHGLLPPHVGTLEVQSARRLQAMRKLAGDLDRYVFLRGLQDANETLFYALLTQNLEEMLPLVYTPTVGEGCQTFSHYWHYPRGLFLSWTQRDRIKEILAHPRFDKVEAIVVSDGERILGLGDQGADGMGIPIGKLSLYTACAGLHPSTTLPVLLDVGTDNKERLADPVYIGWRHERVRGRDYDDFVESFVDAVLERWPHALLQWEDFARANAGRMLQRYRDRLCTFNDDIQGTAAVAAGTLLAAVKVTGQSIRDQRIAIVGAGSAGIGIANLLLRVMIDAGLPEAEARRRFYAIDRDGLLVEGMSGVLDFQRPFAQSPAAVSNWHRTRGDSDRTGRCRRQCRTYGADRSFRSARHLHRRNNPQNGIGDGAPDHLPALEPDLPFRGDAARPDGMDRGPRGDRHGEPVPACCARRTILRHRPDEQRLYLSRHWPRRSGSKSQARDRRHVCVRRQGPRRNLTRRAGYAARLCCPRWRNCARSRSRSPKRLPARLARKVSASRSRTRNSTA